MDHRDFFRFESTLGVDFPLGFAANGGRAGIKRSGKPDLALLWGEKECRVFGAFTKNRVYAAPVALCRERLERSALFRGVVVNSGNANACTGDAGLRDATEMAALAEKATGSPEGSFLVCSTGVIGVKMEMELLRRAIPNLGEELLEGRSSIAPFHEAILTTDTRAKNFGLSLPFTSGEVRIGGCCKGAGMIHPNMATLLAFVTTDLKLDSSFEAEFRAIIDDSFNSITVDGDTSTNDTALLFSSCVSGLSYGDLTIEEQAQFRHALFAMFAELAKSIVRDGEGATRFVEYKMIGATSREQARKLGRHVANSKLVKTALFGQDPNWGRLLSSLGSAGEPIDPQKVTIQYGDQVIFRDGEPTHPPVEELRRVARSPEFTIRFNLEMGTAEATVWSCDLSYDYVKINAEYTT